MPVLPRKPCSCRKGFLAKCSGPHRSAPICRGNRGPCQVFGLCSGSCSSAPGLPITPCSVLVPGQNASVRVEFAEKTVLCEISLVDARARAKPCYASALHAWVRAGSAPDLPRKPCSVLGFSAIVDARGPRSSAAIFPRKPRLVSELNAWVRAGPRRVCRENPAPRCVVVLYRDSTRSALWKFAEFAIS